MILRKHIFTVLLTMAAFLLAGCTRDGDTIVMPDPNETAPSTAPLVTVVYGPNRLGDRAYNDLIYQGVEEAAQEYGLRTLQVSPDSYEQGIAMLEKLFTEMEQTKDDVRRLIIVPESNYGDFLRKNNKRLEASESLDLLFFETDEQLEGKGSTLYIDYYGAMYMGGSMVQSLHDQLVLLIMANPYAQSVVDAGDGFMAGFNDTKPPHDEPSTLKSAFISDQPGGGFSIADSTALRLLNDLSYKYKLDSGIEITIVPICGGSMNTLARSIRAMMWNRDKYIGIDSNHNANTSYCPYSIVKHVDKVVFDYIGKWLDGAMPKHQRLGLKDGATEVVMGDYDFYYKQEFYPDADSLLQVAIGKEAEHAQQ